MPHTNMPGPCHQTRPLYGYLLNAHHDKNGTEQVDCFLDGEYEKFLKYASSSRDTSASTRKNHSMDADPGFLWKGIILLALLTGTVALWIGASLRDHTMFGPDTLRGKTTPATLPMHTPPSSNFGHFAGSSKDSSTRKKHAGTPIKSVQILKGKGKDREIWDRHIEGIREKFVQYKQRYPEHRNKKTGHHKKKQGHTRTQYKNIGKTRCPVKTPPEKPELRDDEYPFEVIMIGL